MKSQKRLPLEEAAQHSGIELEAIRYFIKCGWITPLDSEHQILDDEDLARAQLIWELQHDFGVNPEAIPIILHLIDQINYIHIELKETE
jgi:chaperone modulatory protein CbpM